ncbi:MAG: MoaD/ThiS family protein [Acidimicrobiia bacterium]
MFAQARDAAGVTADDFTLPDPATVAALVDDAIARYGAEFAAVLDTARVWVNGDEPLDGPATLLHDDDEVAVLPPVSGG